MRKKHLTRESLILLLCLSVFLAGCCFNMGCCTMQAKYERTVQLSAPLSSGSTFAAQTYNGSIKINGSDVDDCNLTATVVARAATEEDAKELAEKLNVKLEPSGNRLTARIEKPTGLRNKSVSVSLDVNVPDHVDLELVTHNGSVVVTDITGSVNATTHNGKVTIEKISGSTILNTYNGSIICNEISGDSQLKTHNGSVKVTYSKDSPSVCDISLITFNGSIDLSAPLDLSALVNASTHNGSINTGLPIQVSGKISKNKLTGTIGSGQGRLHLETYNGSIRIK